MAIGAHLAQRPRGSRRAPGPAIFAPDFLAGGAHNDSFALVGGTLSGTINGDDGIDTIVGDNVANTFTLTGANAGTATGVAGGFSNVENLTGNALADSLALLRAGASAGDVVARITDADPLRETRQVGVVGDGGAATFTGTDCSDWAGGVSGGNNTDGWYAVQGNILVGPQVVHALSLIHISEPTRPY